MCNKSELIPDSALFILFIFTLGICFKDEDASLNHEICRIDLTLLWFWFGVFFLLFLFVWFFSMQRKHNAKSSRPEK